MNYSENIRPSRVLMLIEMGDGSRIAYEMKAIEEVVITPLPEPHYDYFADFLSSSRPSVGVHIQATAHDWRGVYVPADADVWGAAAEVRDQRALPTPTLEIER